MSLSIDKLRKSYRSPDGSSSPIIDLNHFKIEDGQQIALTGSSGSGKTTFLHLIAGILSPDSGSIQYQIDNQLYELSQMTEAERDVFRGKHLGYVFQTHHLLPGFSAIENVLLGMSFTGRKADRDWASHLLDHVGLSDRIDYKPEKLSIGQQQRVAVARALANRPHLVLADEPTGALDAKNAQQTLDLIRILCREVNASLLLVTHDLSIASQLDRVVSLHDLNRAAVLAV